MRTDAQRAKDRDNYAKNAEHIRARKLADYYKNIDKYRSPEHLAKRREYYQRTIEQRRLTDKARYWRNREKRLAENKEYRLKNKADLKVKAAIRAKADRLANPDKFLLRQRADRQKHIEKRRKYQRLWSRKNRDKFRKYEAKYLSNHPWVRTAKNNRRRVLLINAKKDDTAEMAIAKIRSAKWLPCNYCGAMIRGRTAHIDHVIPLSRGGSHTAGNLVPACEFCNCSKNNKLVSEWVPPLRQPIINLERGDHASYK